MNEEILKKAIEEEKLNIDTLNEMIFESADEEKIEVYKKLIKIHKTKIEAMEKQIAKEPKITQRTTGYEYHTCSECGNTDLLSARTTYDEMQCGVCGAVLAYNFTNYCPKCGRKVRREGE